MGNQKNTSQKIMKTSQVICLFAILGLAISINTPLHPSASQNKRILKNAAVVDPNDPNYVDPMANMQDPNAGVVDPNDPNYVDPMANMQDPNAQNPNDDKEGQEHKKKMEEEAKKFDDLKKKKELLPTWNHVLDAAVMMERLTRSPSNQALGDKNDLSAHFGDREATLALPGFTQLEKEQMELFYSIMEVLISMGMTMEQGKILGAKAFTIVQKEEEKYAK